MTPYAVIPSSSLSSMIAPRAFSATMPIDAPPLMRLPRITAPAPTTMHAGLMALMKSLRSTSTGMLPATMPAPSSVNLLS